MSNLSDRLMVFVDGSNVLIELATVLGIEHPADKPSDEFLSLACQIVWRTAAEIASHANARVVRKYWFGSVQGSEADLLHRRQLLRSAGYDPQLFHKVKGRNEKGVDLVVAREMLIHGFHRNYDVAVLLAGDADYVGLVQDVKRLGRTVTCSFYEGKALSQELRLSADAFVVLAQPAAANPTLTERLVQAARGA